MGKKLDKRFVIEVEIQDSYTSKDPDMWTIASKFKISINGYKSADEVAKEVKEHMYEYQLLSDTFDHDCADGMCTHYE